ncbi:hypothetical protein NA78x_005022 [Anatilimnocola sp. NA78]|uniref:hypothetical protein n=1 Tax=Anatilimnocola sp. NA78 TaxID=3415683 RepID=UPI003CE47AC7
MQFASRYLPGLALAALLFMGCEKKPDRWAEAQKASTQNPHAVSKEAVAGSEFNRFFPQVTAPWDIVFKQEKTGFAQASLQQNGREVAVLSVSDTANNAEATEKFKDTTKTLGGMPLATIGEQGTAVLVNDRFQVQIRSMDPVFGPAEREEWLTKFNLQAIGRIAAPIETPTTEGK